MDTNCRGVALVRAYSDFVVRALGLHRANAGRPKHFVNVTYSARRASVQWPERASATRSGATSTADN